MKAIIGLILVSILLTPAFAADWSMFKKDPSHSGYTDDAVNTPLTLKWTKDLGFETDSSPVIVDDVIYIGTTFGVFALDAKSGLELWRYHTNGFVKSVPAVADGVLYICADDRICYAIDAKNGTLKWVNTSALNGYTASPVIINNIVYAMPRDGTFYAFDASNGEIIWSTLTGRVSESSPAIGEGIIAFGTDGGDIVALDASTGKVKWKYDTGASDIKSSPAIADGTVFIGSNDGSVYAISSDKGTLKWKYSTSNNIESSPSVKNGVVYVGSRDSGSSFSAIDAGTGKTKWISPNLGEVLSGPAISNNVVYFGTRNNFIYGIDANSGKLLFRNSTGHNDKDYITSPAISGNMLFAVTHGGLLYAYSSEIQSTPTPSMTVTEAIPMITPTASPTVSIVTPSETKRSPGLEFPVLILLVVAFGIIRKKR